VSGCYLNPPRSFPLDPVRVKSGRSSAGQSALISRASGCECRSAFPVRDFIGSSSRGLSAGIRRALINRAISIDRGRTRHVLHRAFARAKHANQRLCRSLVLHPPRTAVSCVSPVLPFERTSASNRRLACLQCSARGSADAGRFHSALYTCCRRRKNSRFRYAVAP